MQHNLYAINDRGIGIIIRALASVTGCVAIAGLGKNIVNNEFLKQSLLWCGVHSLEIYLIHGLVCNILKTNATVEFSSASGIGLVTANFLLTVLLCVVIINLLNENKWTKKILFGK